MMHTIRPNRPNRDRRALRRRRPALRLLPRLYCAAVLCCALLLSGSLPAAAESGALFVFPYEGFRFEAPEGARVLTQHNLGEHADFLAGLGTDEAAMLAGMQSANVVLEVFPRQGGQIELALAPADGIEGAAGARIGEEGRASLLKAYQDMPRYQEVAFPAEQPDWLRMVFSTQQGGLPVYTLRYITVAHGRQYLLSSVLIGRAPEAADDAQALDMIERVSFLNALATPEPTPTPEPSPAPTGTPKPTPGVAERLGQELGEEISLSVAPLPAWTDRATLTVTGAATPRATVRMLLGEKVLDRATAAADGAFALSGTLEESGDYQITIEASAGGGRTASETYAVRLEASKLWLHVTEPTEPVRRKEGMVKGKTEPGAKIDIRGNGLVTNVRANESGDFSFRVKLPEEGAYTYSLTVSLKGYESYQTSCSVVREFNYQEALAAFRKAMVPVDYGKLVKDPGIYADKRASFRSRVAAVGDMDGVPCMLLETRAQGGKWDQPVWALCEEAPPYAVGETFTAYLQFNGESMPYTDGSETAADVPVADLRFHAK